MTSVLLLRWGMDLSTPARDWRRVRRAVGVVERAVTRLDALVTFAWVQVHDLFGIDQLRWRFLRDRLRGGGYGSEGT